MKKIIQLSVLTSFKGFEKNEYEFGVHLKPAKNEFKFEFE